MNPSASDPNHIDATIADLESRRDQINFAIETLKQLRHGTTGSATPVGAVVNSSGVDREIRHDSFFGMTLMDGIKKYLAISKQTKSAPNIAESLARGGMKSSAKDFTGNVRSTLSKNDDFVRVNGEWGLAEWYPAMRKERKPKAAIADEESTGQGGAVDDHETAGERILATIRSSSTTEWTASKITEATGLKPNTVRGTIFSLRHAGKITNRQIGNGYIIA